MADEAIKIGDLQTMLAMVHHPLFNYTVKLTSDDFFVFEIFPKCSCNSVDVDPVSVKTHLLPKAGAKNFVKNIVEILGKRLAKEPLIFDFDK